MPASPVPPSFTAPLSRRRFLLDSTLALSALSLASRSALAATGPSGNTGGIRWPIAVFSKAFQHLNAEKTAELVASIGFNGIECPVRPKGQIEPEKAPDLLPVFVDALRKRGCDMYVATTDITRIDQKHADSTLRTLSRLGVRRIRLGYYKYDLSQSPADQLADVSAKLKDIAAACSELGIQAGYQNHSGRNYVGAPVWDIYSAIKDLDPRHIGFCFDICHATIEGGLDWRIQAKLVEPHLTAVYLKDFIWTKTDKGWIPEQCQFGKGTVDRSFLATLKESSYRGPLCQHHEYRWKDDAELITKMRQDLSVLKQWLAA
ncbi:MAG: sugar phosphate isomerase/epimerase [Opitutaceae bacterium]|nr:sugar phosphate isomerase/epimerase [Opitutaceae bacterium]